MGNAKEMHRFAFSVCITHTTTTINVLLYMYYYMRIVVLMRWNSLEILQGYKWSQNYPFVTPELVGLSLCLLI